MIFENLNPASAIDDAIAAIDSGKVLIVCGPPASQGEFESLADPAEITPDEMIEQTPKFDLDRWFSQQREYLALDNDYESESDWEEVAGDWPTVLPPHHQFTMTSDILSGKTLHAVVGFRIATDASWKVMAHLPYGGWNECPSSEIHCALWRRWEEKYGAKIISIAPDTIEAYVQRPPTTKEAAMELAWEQFLYCSDIVHQGTETTSALAASLLNSRAWFFWWD